MQRPGGTLFKAALDGKSPFARVVRDLEMQPGALFRQNERPPNLEVFDHERTSFKEVLPDFQHELNKSRGWENDMAFNFVIAQVGHVSAIEASGPRWSRARQAQVEQSASSRRQTAQTPIPGLIPPAVFVPSIS